MIRSALTLWLWVALSVASAQETITQTVDPDVLHMLTASRPAAWHVIDPPDYRAALAVGDQREFILYTGTTSRKFVVLSFASAASPDEPPVSAKYILTVNAPSPTPTPPSPPAPAPIPPSVRNEYGVGQVAYDAARAIANKDKHAEIAGVFVSAAEWLTAKDGTEAELQECADRIGATFRSRLKDRPDWDAFIAAMSESFQDNPKITWKTTWQGAYRETAAAILAAAQ